MPTELVTLLQTALVIVASAAAGPSQSLFHPNPFVPVPQPPHPYHMIVGEVTGDGYPDAIIGESFVGSGAMVQLFVFPGTGQAAFGSPVISALAAGIPSSWGFVAPIAVIDINGDGLLDIVSIRNSTTTGSYPHGFSPLINSGGGSFTAGLVGPAIPFVIANYTNFAVGDLDNDGGADAVCAGLLTPSSTTDVLKVYSTTGPPFTFVETYSQSLSYGVTSIALFDMNNDGLRDLVYERFVQGSPVQVVVLPRSPGGAFGSEIISYWPTQAGPIFGAYQVSVGDVNGDGFADVVGMGYGNYGPPGPGEVVTLVGNGTGALTPGSVFATTVPAGQFGPPPYGDASLGDFDLDGQFELRTIGKITRLTPAFGGVNVTSLDNSLLVASSTWGERAADVDLDGDLDIVQVSGLVMPSGQVQLLLGAAINRTVERTGCGGLSVTTGVPAPGNPGYVMAVGLGPANAVTALGLSLSAGFNVVGPCIVGLDLAPGQLILPMGSLGIMTTDAGGSAQAIVSIPNDPTLVGTDYFLQWIVVDPAGPINLLGINYSLSEARRILLW